MEEKEWSELSKRQQDNAIYGDGQLMGWGHFDFDAYVYQINSQGKVVSRKKSGVGFAPPFAQLKRVSRSSLLVVILVLSLIAAMVATTTSASAGGFGRKCLQRKWVYRGGEPTLHCVRWERNWR